MIKLKLRATHADGTEVEVTAGAREFVQWERRPDTVGTPRANRETPLYFWTFCAWQALKFQNRTSKGYDAWCETLNDIEVVDDDSDVDPTRLDPPPAG